MTDQEFDVLDELYFVQSFAYLKEELSLSVIELKSVLHSLVKQGWIKCLYNMNDEVFEDELDFEKKYEEYFYLASKKGLLAHNGR